MIWAALYFPLNSAALWTSTNGIEIFVDGNQIVLKKYSPSCIFCGEADDVREFKGKLVCSKCIGELSGK